MKTKNNKVDSSVTVCFPIFIQSDNAPYLGVGPMNGAEDEALQRHAYYQWVPMVLAIQTMILYFPKWLWKEMMDQRTFSSVLLELDHFNFDQKTQTDKVLS